MTDNKNQFKKNTLKQEKTEDKAPKAPKSTKSKKVSSDSGNAGFISFFKDTKFLKITGLFFIALSVFLLVSFISYLLAWKNDYDKIHFLSAVDLFFNTSLTVNNWGGKVGGVLAHFFITRGFGISAFAFILLIAVSGIKFFLNDKSFKVAKYFIYSFLSLIWIPIMLGFFFRSGNGLLQGVFGYEANIWLNSIIGQTGTALLLLFVFIAFLIITFNIAFSFKWLQRSKENIVDAEADADEVYVGNTYNGTSDNENEENEDENLTEEELAGAIDFTVVTEEEQQARKKTNSDDSEPIFEIANPNSKETLSVETEVNGENGDEPIHITTDQPYDPTMDLPDFQLPGLDLLEDYGDGLINVEKDELEANKNRIIQTLNNYAIKIDKIKATIGPTVTLYEIIPAPGVRISKIKNLEDDIALSLSALGIRIIAPMPGKGTIGIEVPNMKPEIVSMKSMLSSDKFINSTHVLPIALGKTISNEPYITDLTKMPHLLMAGATGQGKSVGLNAIIASLLYKKHPAYLKFVLVDPKKVELTLFSRIERHYLARLPDSAEAIITDTRQVVRTLNALCIEMDQRYDLLKDAQVRNIREYNAKFISRLLNPNDGHRFMPYIILVVDEFADLFMTAGREIETPIARLAQLARAIGIHLIIATQRPSVNIITGTIKANFPARMAFRVISKIDSRTILDMGGADQLVGRGDMLLSTGSDLVRLQCPFVDTPEVEKITEFIGAQRAYPEVFLLPDCPDDSAEEPINLDPNDRDELFEDAARIIVQHQHGSTSLLQRKLKLGYNRAGRLIDQLEAAGIVGPFEGSKAREVKVKDEIALEQFLSNPNTRVF